MVTPGLDFIARSSVRLLLPCVFVYATLLLCCDFTNFAPPTWALIISSLGLRVAYMFSNPWFKEYKNIRMARAHGAVLPPHIKENHLDIVRSFNFEVEYGYPGDTPERWSCEYGAAFRFSIGFDERYYTTEPDHVKSILSTEFEKFDKGPILFSQLRSLLGTGVFNSDGDMWKFHRSITRPFFNRDRITDLDIFDRHAEDALKRAKDRLAEGYPIDFQDLVSRFTLDSATEYLFKNDVHSLSAGLPYPSHPSPLARSNPSSFTNYPANEFAKAFVAGQDIVARRIHLGIFWPLREMWGDVVAPKRKAVDDFVEPFLEKGFSEKGTKGESEEETLLDYLVNKTSDRELIRDELINLLVASRDTTASLLSFSLYMLIEHPDLCQRLRKEILTKVGHKRAPTVDDIRDMKFLRAFLNEVLRLYPGVPFNVRTATKPVIFAPSAGSDCPIYVPADMVVVYSVFMMHRRTDLWGPDALEFDPDRFLDERVHKICLGQQFAYNEASFFLIRLLQRFSSFTFEADAYPSDCQPNPEWAGIAGPKGRDKIRLRTHLTLYIKGGLWVRMKEAESEDS